MLAIRDTYERYGLVSRALHWIMAAAIVALFALGVWMVRLDYYDPYYNSAPAFHRAAGILTLVALLLRIAWRLASVRPARPGLTPFERTASRIVHRAFYPLLLILMMSGYLISTADGRTIDVFGIVQIPALIESRNIASLAGTIHRWCAYAVITLAAIHALAAAKHSWTDRFASAPRSSAS